MRDTHAIGIFTKLSLKNQVDDLLAHFKSFHHGQVPPTLQQLRQDFELLLIKVVTVGTVDSAGHYPVPAISTSSNAVVQAALAAAPQTNFAIAVVGLIQSGQVQATSNPQVVKT